MNIQALADFLESVGDFPLNIGISECNHWATDVEEDEIYLYNKGSESYEVFEIIQLKDFKDGNFLITFDDEICMYSETQVFNEANRISMIDFLNLYHYNEEV